MTAHRSPKRVLLSADAVGGVWHYTRELAAAFSRRRVEVEIAVLGPRITPAQAAAVALPSVRLHETGLPLDWTAREPGSLASASNALASLARQLGVDTIQLHTPATVAQSTWHAPVLAVVHSCVGSWWKAVRSDAPPEDFLWRMGAVRAGLAAAQKVVVPTHALAHLLRATYELPRGIEVVHNGRASPAHPVRDAAEAFGVLTAGRLWDEGKNIAVLDEAAPQLGDVPVLAAGATDGPNGAHVQVRHLRPLGLLDEAAMARAMSAARIFASPALYEPFGLAVLEAAQAGLPLVLADIPSFRELWDGAAVFLPPRDVQAWGATLASLHAEPAACRRWGMKARARAATYTVERFDGAMWEKHCQLLDAAAPRAAAAA